MVRFGWFGEGKLNEDQYKTSDSLSKRRVPCIITFLEPFRLVDGPESAPWNISINDINRVNWDYVQLHELVGGVDVGLPPPYHLAIGRDGALALPPLPELCNHQEAVEFFNRCLAALLLGGIYCKAISLDDISVGGIIDWKYIRTHTAGKSASSRFHNLIRLCKASAFEAIELMTPRTEKANHIKTAMATRREILAAVPELSGEFLLKGVTGIARCDWGTALANLWIVVEQLTSALWTRHVLKPAKGVDLIPGRIDQLSDTRSWTIAARHEMLHQLGILPVELLSKLSVARKSRNALAHAGVHPKSEPTRALYDAVVGLLEITAPGLELPMKHIDLADHTVSDPFAPRLNEKIKPSYWMEIPKLPGEEELERLEAAARREHYTKSQL